MMKEYCHGLFPFLRGSWRLFKGNYGRLLSSIGFLQSGQKFWILSQPLMHPSWKVCLFPIPISQFELSCLLFKAAESYNWFPSHNLSKANRTADNRSPLAWESGCLQPIQLRLTQWVSSGPMACEKSVSFKELHDLVSLESQENHKRNCEDSRKHLHEDDDQEDNGLETRALIPRVVLPKSPQNHPNHCQPSAPKNKTRPFQNKQIQRTQKSESKCLFAWWEISQCASTSSDWSCAGIASRSNGTHAQSHKALGRWSTKQRTRALTRGSLDRSRKRPTRSRKWSRRSSRGKLHEKPKENGEWILRMPVHRFGFAWFGPLVLLGLLEESGWVQNSRGFLANCSEETHWSFLDAF